MNIDYTQIIIGLISACGGGLLMWLKDFRKDKTEAKGLDIDNDIKMHEGWMRAVKEYRDEYEQVLKKYHELQSKIEDVLLMNKRLESEKEDLKARKEVLKAENTRYKTLIEQHEKRIAELEETVKQLKQQNEILTTPANPS
jgi:chromosome segregation ATPase